MKSTKFIAGLAVLAVATINPVFASASTRSAASLPLMAASVGSVPYSSGVEETWTCASVTDEALKLNDDGVQVDEAGRVVLDPQGKPYTCNAPKNGYKLGGGGGGFPVEIGLGLLVAGGLGVGLAGGGSGDTPG